MEEIGFGASAVRPHTLRSLDALLIYLIRLAESIREMLALTLAPTVPASLKNIPQKYNLIIRLWTHAFYHLLESLRHAARPPTNSLVALEYLQVSQCPSARLISTQSQCSNF